MHIIAGTATVQLSQQPLSCLWSADLSHLYCFFGSSGSFGGSIRYLQYTCVHKQPYKAWPASSAADIWLPWHSP